MTVEAATYISQLNPSFPAAGDAHSEGDDHIRKIKSTLQATWPNLTATPITPTSADLNAVAGAGATGATNFKVATQPIGDNSTKAASTAYADAAVAAASFATVLPSQSGNGGKFVTTDGTNASWSSLPVPMGSLLYLQANYGAF